MRILHDISPLISEKTAVWPGDIPFERSIALDAKKGDHLTLSSIETTVHLGAHTDAPSHYHSHGAPIHLRKLDYYLGACEVVSVRIPRGARIFPEHLGPRKITSPRVLIKTQSFPDPDQWNSDFNSLSPELIDFLFSQGVILVGIDTPSIDPMESKGLESHLAVYRHDMAILEGIVLKSVPDGNYTLVALPLRIEGADASPVRAVLLEPVEVPR